MITHRKERERREREGASKTSDTQQTTKRISKHTSFLREKEKTLRSNLFLLF